MKEWANRRRPWVAPELAGPDGLVGVGGDLRPATLVQAYSEGVFPWFNEGDPILWWSPDPRAVIELDGLHISRSLARTIRSGRFRVTVNRAFGEVIRGCAVRPGEGTWVTPPMIAAYEHLHRLGHAHSVETWVRIDTLSRNGAGAAGIVPSPLVGEGQGGGEAQRARSEPSGPARLPPHPGPPPPGGREKKMIHPGQRQSREAATDHGDDLSGWTLAGGIYGVAIGGLFAGESMFYRVTDGSKVALVALVERLRDRGYVLFDVQMRTDHTTRLGAIEIPRADYLRRLRAAVRMSEVRFV